MSPVIQADSSRHQRAIWALVGCDRNDVTANQHAGGSETSFFIAVLVTRHAPCMAHPECLRIAGCVRGCSEAAEARQEQSDRDEFLRGHEPSLRGG